MTLVVIDTQSSSIGTSGISNLSSSIVLLITDIGYGMKSQGIESFKGTRKNPSACINR